VPLIQGGQVYRNVQYTFILIQGYGNGNEKQGNIQKDLKKKQGMIIVGKHEIMLDCTMVKSYHFFEGFLSTQYGKYSDIHSQNRFFYLGRNNLIRDWQN